MTVKIALLGKMRTGKDTIAEHLISNYGFTQFAFGTGIKETAQILFPEQLKEGKNRKLYQKLGQEMRKINPNVWIDYCFREIQNTVSASSPVVISDLRQLNEYRAVKGDAYIVFKVVTDSEKQMQRILDAGDKFKKEDLEHETEVETDSIPYDFLISNTGTLDELYQQVDSAMEKIMGG